MQTRVTQCGKGLGVRIPKAFLAQFKLKKNEVVNLSCEDGRMIILPAQKKKKRTLEETIAQITPENLHGVVDWGRPVGKEVW